jgi:uroporphyrinogen decarboxylase
MRIVARVKTVHPHVPVIGFPNRCGAAIGQYTRMTAVDAVQIDSGTPIGWARTQVPANTAIQGNLDPQLVVAGGPVLLNEADRICRAMSGQPFVFNLGHGIVPETPPENVGQLSALLRGERPV